jgi:hypothetical protein
MIGQLTQVVLGVPDDLGMSRRRKLAILGTGAVVAVAFTAILFWILGKSEQTARDASTRFAAALVHNDPSKAPPGADAYVTGVRAYFGPVTSARVIGARNKHVNTGDNADTRSFFVTQLLLRSKRGPAVIEVEFDNHALFSDRVSSVSEVEPDDARGLSSQDRRQVEAAYAAGGGEAADLIAVDTARAAVPAPTPAAVPTSPAAPKRTARQRAARKQLRCVQRAGGDVARLQECARS